MRVHGVHAREPLVADRVAHAGAVARRAALLADGVDLVHDDDVQVRLVAALRVLGVRVGEELADVLLGLAHKLGEDLGAVDDLRLARAERARAEKVREGRRRSERVGEGQER